LLIKYVKEGLQRLGSEFLLPFRLPLERPQRMSV